jgi:hypothetical protein
MAPYLAFGVSTTMLLQFTVVDLARLLMAELQPSMLENQIYLQAAKPRQ